MIATLFRRPLAVAALTAAGLTAGCTDRAPASRDTGAANNMRAPVSDTLKGPGVREGVWQGADAHSSWRATIDGAWITQIDEVALFTDSARAMRQFHFDSSGFLASAREEREQTVYGNKAAPDTVHTLIELEWQRDSLSRSAKRVNGADRLLQPYEVDNLRAHADDLRRIARTGTTTSSPGSKP